MGVKKQVAEKSDTFVFFLIETFSQGYNYSLPTKPRLELIYVQNDVTFAVVLALTSFVCKMAAVWAEVSAATSYMKVCYGKYKNSHISRTLSANHTIR